MIARIEMSSATPTPLSVGEVPSLWRCSAMSAFGNV